jgi:hypothetical protein
MGALYGEHKEAADFSYDGRWSYQPLVVSLGGSGECLRVVNQPGNARSSEAAAGALRQVLPWVQRHFRNALVRGDTDFDRADILQAAIDSGAYFALGGRVYPNRAALAQALPESAWQPFIPRGRRRKVCGWAARRRSVMSSKAKSCWSIRPKRRSYGTSFAVTQRSNRWPSLCRELEARSYRTKPFTSSAGHSYGGKPFTRGHLYRILQNRVYRGERVLELVKDG